MEKTAAVKSAVEDDRIVVACAYQGYLADELLAALPTGFSHVRYVAKFVDGVLVAIQPGTPETAIQQLLGASAADDHKSSEQRTCDTPMTPARP